MAQITLKDTTPIDPNEAATTAPRGLPMPPGFEFHCLRDTEYRNDGLGFRGLGV